MPEAWDDMNNVLLEPDKVAAARAEEMSFFNKLGVYQRVPRAIIKQVGGKLVSVSGSTRTGEIEMSRDTDPGWLLGSTMTQRTTLYMHLRHRLRHRR